MHTKMSLCGSRSTRLGADRQTGQNQDFDHWRNFVGEDSIERMQDIAGCRVIVPDILTQDEVVAGLNGLFESQ